MLCKARWPLTLQEESGEWELQLKTGAWFCSPVAEFSYLADPVSLPLVTLLGNKGCSCPKGPTLATCLWVLYTCFC